MDWRVAKSLNVLLAQINTLAPGRDKSSDGSIGNAEHASRNSDHNPWVHDHNGQPIVTARDFTNDPKHMDSHELALLLIESRDDRIKYVIDHGHICSGRKGPSPWVWRTYSGANAHDHHCHVSVLDDEKYFDDERPWRINFPEQTEEQLSAKAAMPPAKTYPVLRRGSKGADVVELQKILNGNGANLKADGDFGPGTEAAVKKYQSEKKLVADGVVGKYTWKSLEA